MSAHSFIDSDLLSRLSSLPIESRVPMMGNAIKHCLKGGRAKHNQLVDTIEKRLVIPGQGIVDEVAPATIRVSLKFETVNSLHQCFFWLRLGADTPAFKNNYIYSAANQIAISFQMTIIGTFIKAWNQCLSRSLF